MTTSSLATVLQDAISAGVADLHVSMPGTIVKFDAASQTAQVKVSTGDFPVISAVPVVFEGAGGFAITFPVQAGDPCLLVFQDKSIDQWSEGQSGTPTDPRTHSLMDVVAILGARSSSNKLTEFDSNRMVVGTNGPRIALDGAAVHLGVAHLADAAQQAVRGDAHLQALKDYLDAIVGLLNSTTSSPSGGPLIFAAPVPAGLATTALATAKTAFNAAQHLTSKVKLP